MNFRGRPFVSHYLKHRWNSQKPVGLMHTVHRSAAVPVLNLNVIVCGKVDKPNSSAGVNMICVNRKVGPCEVVPQEVVPLFLLQSSFKQLTARS